MDVVIILGCLCALMYLAWRGFSVILLAPACGLLAVALMGKAILPAYTELFMIKTVGFIKSYFPVFFSVLSLVNSWVTAVLLAVSPSQSLKS